MTTSPSPQQPGPPPPETDRPSRGPFGLPTRWLIIGGGTSGLVLLLVIVVVAMALSGVFSGGNPQPKSILDLVPDDAEAVRRSNVGEILAVDFLADELFPNGVFSAEHLGINDEDIDHFVTATWNSGAVDVVQGDFELDDIRLNWKTPGLKRTPTAGTKSGNSPSAAGWRCSTGTLLPPRRSTLWKASSRTSTTVPVR